MGAWLRRMEGLRVSGFGRVVLLGVVVATVAGIAGLRAQTQLADPKDAPKIFASTCSACHKSPQGLAKSGQVAGFLRQHYTTGPEMSAAMAAYLVAAGNAPASKKGQEKTAAAASGQPPAEKGRSKKQEQAAGLSPTDHQPDAKERHTLRAKQQAKAAVEPAASAPAAPVHMPPAVAAEPAARQAAVPAALPEQTPTAEPAGPAPMVLDIPMPEMPTAPPADLTQSVFATSPVP